MKQIARALLALSATLAFSSAFAANIEFNGYYEGYYLYNMNTPQDAGGTPGLNSGRLNDRNHNVFTTGLIEVGAKGAATKTVSYNLEIGYGDLNDALHGDDENRDLVDQGYLTVAPNALGGWKFDIGRFYSHMGLETAKAKDNWNFSRSLSYTYAMPHWHEGLRTEIMNTATIGVNAYLYNGSDVTDDNNDGKSLGARVRYSPTHDLTVTYNLLFGPEQNNTESNSRMVNNVNAKWTLNDKLALAGELTLGNEDGRGATGEDAQWTALAAYIKYAFNDKGYIAGRFEHYSDDDGLTLNNNVNFGDDIDVNSLTATLGWDQGDGLMTWAELRHDSASEEVLKKDLSDFSKSQTTVLVGLTYSL